MAAEETYDLIVIGSGSGNSLANDDFKGMKTAIIDGGRFGGTCLNFGCIPTKMYVYPASILARAREAKDLGIELEHRSTHWQQIRDRIFSRIDPISEGGLSWRKSLPNVDVYEEYAQLTGPHSVKTASGKLLTAKQLVLATGSRPSLPQVPGVDLPQVHTSDTIMRVDQLPKRLLVVGGGFIASEFSHVFSSLGAQVTQAIRSDQLLRKHDATISEIFTSQAARQWDLRTGYSLEAIEELQDGSVQAIFEAGGQKVTIPADLVLLATGRTPNSDTLGAANYFDLDERGLVQVDQYQRVLSGGQPLKGVWALGDVSSPFQLKHVANAEMRTVQWNILHPDQLRATDHRYVPSAVFSYPPIASVGLTEEEARQRAAAEGFELAIKEQKFADVAYGWAMEDQVGLCKLIARKDSGELLGAHIIGEEAPTLIQPLIQAMSFGLSAQDMARGQYWIHPALTEVVENALLGLDLDL